MEQRVNQEQRKNNLRLAWVLASVAAVFFVGVVVKMLLLRA